MMIRISLFVAAVVFSTACSFSQVRTSAMLYGSHDLRASKPSSIRGSTDDLCAYCHTPHVPTTGIKEPLWSRAKLSTTKSYTSYASSTLDANPTALQNGDANNSAMCMSCHDGSNIFSLTKYTKYPGGSEANPDFVGPKYNLLDGSYYSSGLHFTHPVNFTYDDALATMDGALRMPATILNKLPLFDGKVQCSSCHDPHVPASIRRYFLRTTESNGILCISCHDK